MASLTPFSFPNSGDKSWVDHISKTLKSQLAVTIDTPPVSIFEIPKTLKAEKLEAYTPQRIGLGPNHHFRPELYQKMEQNKLTAVKRVLSPHHQDLDYEDQIVEKVKGIIPIVCACYDLYLDVDDDTLAWLFAIDGLFLLDHLGAYSDHQFGIEAKDLIMLENQIPLIVLKEIQKAVSGENGRGDQEDYWESKLQFFCKSHSPFLLSDDEVDFGRVNHLLDYMYHSIVNNETSVSREVVFTDREGREPEKDAKIELLEAFIRLGGLIPGARPFLDIVESIRKNLFDGMEEKATVEEIRVPSVSELGEIAGVKFRLSPKNEGIRNINFVVEKGRSCYLPIIKLNFDSEVILRNLVAYEQLMAKNSFAAGYGLELTEYVDFMCGIIDTAKDVRLLRKEKIIEGELGDEEIVRLFNGIGRSHGKMSVESKLRKTVAELNKVYESVPSVWVRKAAENQVRGSAKAITFLISISSTLILIREVYSKVYGSNPPHLMLVRFLSEQIQSFSSLIQGCGYQPFFFIDPRWVCLPVCYFFNLCYLINHHPLANYYNYIFGSNY